LNWLPL